MRSRVASDTPRRAAVRGDGAARSVTVTVVNIGIVRVAVTNGAVDMPMRMRLAGRRR